MVYRLKDAHLGRYRRIAQVLARHGLEYLIGVLGLERLVVVRPVLRGRPREARTRPEHVRMALAELGATFIKLGQILSTRPDLLPPAYQREFARLQDNVPPVPAGVVEEVLGGELGRPVGEVFAAFDPTPLAAASIGQAHAATLHDGAAVVVKVRRPGIVEQVAEDLEIMQNLAAAASRRWEFASQYDLVGLAQEFAQTLQAELDYLREGRNAERFAANFAGDPAVHIPRVYWETTTSRVLTLERIEGIKIDDLDALDAAGIDRTALAERATRVILKMVFEDGFFHADPHPGNFFIEPGGRIALIDFGMVGTVDEDTRGRLVQLLLAVAGRDAERMVDAFLDLGVARGRLDRHLLRHDLDRMLARYYDRPLGEIALGALLEEAFAVIRRHHLQLPANLALLMKTTVMAEGLGARLDPDFNLAAVLLPYAERLILREYSPLLWARRLGQATLDAARLGIDLPQQLRRIIGEFERGNLEVGMRPEGFEPLLRRFERLANRIVLGIIAAAFVNGLAVLVSVYHPPGWDRWAGAFVALGFFFASALGLYLAWTILRSGRG
ncbi:MAG TPA: AarF/ABC1/UbiB kinase family protein [Thermomicrobiales bacterium]|nr:AarF/ABC1/UbiB kinase family protein [Thermomicrobiales bacterium]